MSTAQLHFELIAAKAKLMAQRTNGYWAGELHEACADIRKSLDAIQDEARRHDASDR